MGQTKMLQDLWKTYDDDSSGKLELREVEQVIAAVLPDMSAGDLEAAFREMDADGAPKCPCTAHLACATCSTPALPSPPICCNWVCCYPDCELPGWVWGSSGSGEVDFQEFSDWWATQGEMVRGRVQDQAFEKIMDSLGEGEVTHVIIDTAQGPAQVRLVGPRGLFRLVIRSKSTAAKDFYEWAEKLVTRTRTERQGRRNAVVGVASVSTLCQDYALRNVLVTTKNNDTWMLHGKVALGYEQIRTFTMPSPLVHKPNLLCTKAYWAAPVPPKVLAELMWDWNRRPQWDLLLADSPTILDWIDAHDAVVRLDAKACLGPRVQSHSFAHTKQKSDSSEI